MSSAAYFCSLNILFSSYMQMARTLIRLLQLPKDQSDLGPHSMQFWLSKNTVRPVLSGHSKRGQKIVFQDQLSLNAGQK